MQRLTLKLLALLIALAVALPGHIPVRADQPRLSVNDHAWGRFNVGAWKKVRVVTETLDEQEGVTSTSTTDTTTVLADITPEDYQLQIDVAVEVAGRKFEADTQHVTHGFLGETEGQSSAFKNSSATTITIEGKDLRCEVYTVEVADDSKKRVSKIYYVKNFNPPVVRKETVTTNASGTSILDETVETVVSVNMPYKVLNEIMSTWHVKTVRTHPKGSTITLSICADAIPGGVVAHSSKELDASGKLIRRSTLELVDYGLEPDRRTFLRLGPFKRNDASGRRRR